MVVQATAYLAAEFIGADGVKDVRLTEIINRRSVAPSSTSPRRLRRPLPHFREDVLRAFLGSVDSPASWLPTPSRRRFPETLEERGMSAIDRDKRE